MTRLKIFLGWHRVEATILVGVALFLFSRQTIASVLLGLPFVLAGEAIRIWASGYILKGEELTTVGPYGYVRHPLYLGNFFMGAGFALMGGSILLLGIFLLVLALIYKATVETEERDLILRFGEAYRTYARQVPALLPRIHTERTGQGRTPSFRWDLVRKHREHRTWCGVAGGIAIFFLRAVTGW